MAKPRSKPSASSRKGAQLDAAEVPHPELFQPIELGSCKIGNRIVMAPMNVLMSSGNTGLVNDQILAYYAARAPDILVMLSDGLLLSRDGGRSWAEWRSGVEFGEGLACVAAPQGLDPDAPLLVGLVDGGVLRI